MTPEEIIKVLREVDADAKASEGDYYADQFAWHGAGEIADAVEQMAAEIARLREERRWIPVGERLPELNEANHFQFNCLVYCGNRHVCEMTYEINAYAKQERHRQPRWRWHGMISTWDITHWMPLPPGPEAAQ